jgi:acylphosphatase
MLSGEPIGSWIRVRVRFEGQVQGVGFRYSTVAVAARRVVTGYVANLRDGAVELVAEGTREELEGFLADLRRASVYRYVSAEQRAWSAATGEFPGFDVRYV